MGKITNLTAYPQPGIPAFFNGTVVRLIATGDMEGMSSVEKYVDDHGRIGWAKTAEVTILDCPSSNAAMTEALKLSAKHKT